MNAVLHAHSGLRWVVLILVLIAVIQGFSGKGGGKEFTKGNKMIALFGLITSHIMLVLGLILFFVNKWPQTFGVDGIPWHFFGLAHPILMLVSIIFITRGYSTHKKIETDAGKFKRIGVYYLIGLLVMLAGIPWPFFGDVIGRGWF